MAEGKAPGGTTVQSTVVENKINKQETFDTTQFTKVTPTEILAKTNRHE